MMRPPKIAEKNQAPVGAAVHPTRPGARRPRLAAGSRFLLSAPFSLAAGRQPAGRAAAGGSRRSHHHAINLFRQQRSFPTRASRLQQLRSRDDDERRLLLLLLLIIMIIMVVVLLIIIRRQKSPFLIKTKPTQIKGVSQRVSLNSGFYPGPCMAAF